MGTRTLRRIGIPLCRWIAGRAKGKSACVWKQTRKWVCADGTFPRQRVGFHYGMVERVLFNKGHGKVSMHLGSDAHQVCAGGRGSTVKCGAAVGLPASQAKPIGLGGLALFILAI